MCVRAPCGRALIQCAPYGGHVFMNTLIRCALIVFLYSFLIYPSTWHPPFSASQPRTTQNRLFSSRRWKKNLARRRQAAREMGTRLKENGHKYMYGHQPKTTLSRFSRQNLSIDGPPRPLHYNTPLSTLHTRMKLKNTYFKCTDVLLHWYNIFVD